jgi:four helix bundle protein
MPTYEDLKVYQTGLDLRAETWGIVRAWTYFHKDTLGKQIVRSAESVPANIAKGMAVIRSGNAFGFVTSLAVLCLNARDTSQTVHRRSLIDETKHEELVRKRSKRNNLTNGFIRYIRGRMRSACGR